MMAGHAVIEGLRGLRRGRADLAASRWSPSPAMYALEILVAFIQAYVFTILTCVYLKDALHPGH